MGWYGGLVRWGGMWGGTNCIKSQSKTSNVETRLLTPKHFKNSSSRSKKTQKRRKINCHFVKISALRPKTQYHYHKAPISHNTGGAYE